MMKTADFSVSAEESHACRQEHYTGLISECGRDIKAVNRLCDQLLGNKKEAILPKHTSDADLAEAYSHFFMIKIETIRQAIPGSSGSPNDLETRFSGDELSILAPATEGEIEFLIRSSPSKSCSLDPLPTWLLKKVSPHLTSVIMEIINKSLETSTVPSVFKRAIVRPLLKKPGLDPEVLKNYRPVSNLPYVSKLLEKVVCVRIEEHLKKNKLLDDMQSAYRRHCSTETCLIRVNNDILEALDQGHHAALILLDLSAAFDTLDHKIFLQRTENTLGITGSALAWLRSYLSNRTQAVAIGDSLSKDAKLAYGVPQGSVLGPRGYCMYTLPLGEILRRHKMTYMIYADDTQAYVTFTNETQWQGTCTAIAACVNDIKRWMSNNFLKLNQEKTEFIVFSPKARGTSHGLHQIQLGDVTVRSSDHVRNLGVIQDSALNMERQINNTTKYCYYHLRRIAKARSYLPPETRKSLVHASVISRLDYSNALYTGLPNTLLGRLQKTQNAAARVITGAKWREHISPHLKDLHWLPIAQRVKYKVLLHTFKALNGQAPQYLQSLVSKHAPKRNLRSCSKSLLTVPRYRTVRYGERTFKVAAAKLWNELPEGVKNCGTVQSFKKQLKTHLFCDAFNQT